MHPNFRIIALANRPGFPFLGNDFFGACGDSFSSFAIDNPTLESEKQMLIKYAPDIDGSILDRLVATFAELRSLADQGEFIFEKNDTPLSIVTLSPKNTPEIDYPKKVPETVPV